MNRAELLDLSRWSREELARDSYRNVIQSGLIHRERLGLGGSHSVVSYPPLDFLQPLDANEVVSAAKPVSELNVYLHIAFCEFICGFCHYETTRTTVGQ